jgi:transposase-like protein
MTEASPTRYRRHRFPAEIITNAVWLYYRFPLNYRDVVDMPAERGIEVSFQTVLDWRRSLASNSLISCGDVYAVTFPTKGSSMK